MTPVLSYAQNVDRSTTTRACRMRSLVILLLTLFAGFSAHAQSCPPASSADDAPQASILHGTVVYHDELRQWLGLKLDHLACGQSEIQIVITDSNAMRTAETLRQCNVTATGKLFSGLTGYFPVPLAIENPQLKPDPSCHPLPLRPDPTAAPIPSGLKAFQVSITVDYRGKGRIEVKVWKDQDETKLLAPWQAYVSYTLTGGADVMWFRCEKNYRIKDITQIPKSTGDFLQLEPDFTGTTFQNQDGLNTVTFTCRKDPGSADAKAKPPQAKLQ